MVNTLLPSLEDAGLRVCIDFRDFVPGKPSRHNMRDACKESAYTVLVMTPAWIASEWTSFEGLLTFLHDPAGKRQRTVPMMVEQCDIPEDIQIFTYVDFLREDRANMAWKQLFTALGKPNAKIPGEPAKNQIPETPTPDSWFLKHPYGMPPHFTGRRMERNMLTGWLNADKDHPLLIIRALGGFGKSALTWHWLTHDVDPKSWTKVVFWSFYEGDASFENFLKETLLYLGVRNAEQMNPRQQTELLLNFLRTPGILLILDGFERVLRAYGNMSAAYQGDELKIDKDEKRDASRDCINIFADAFLRSIGAYAGYLKSKVLMTTRLTPSAVYVGAAHASPLQGVREEELTAMSKADAVEFFHAQGIRGTHVEIESACEPYGYHPLSLRILSGWIVNDRNHPGDISAAQHLEITKDIIQNKHHILDVGFNSLNPAQQKLLGRVACFRAAMDYDALKTLHGDGKGSHVFDESLKILESRGLLQWDRKANKYDLHPIVRRYAYDRLTAADRAGAHERLVNYFEAVPKPEKVEKLEDLAPIIELYHHMVGAGNLDEAWELFRDRITNPAYYQFGAYQLCIELLRALFLDGEDKPPRLKDEAWQAWTLNGLANSYSLSGQSRRAVPLLEMTNDIYENKMKNKQYLAIGLGNVADDQLKIGALSAAERNLRREIDICKEIEDKFWEADGHNWLGVLNSITGNTEIADQEFARSISLFEEAKGNMAFSTVWANRGKANLNASNISLAFENLRHSLALADEWTRTQYPMPRDYVRAHWLLGAAYRANNELTLAEENLSKALNLCRQINLVDHEANILLDLARLRYTQNDFKDAQEKASEALVITERSGYVLQGADVNLFLAELAISAGEKGEGKESLEKWVMENGGWKDVATRHAQEALKLATCDGGEYKYKVAYDEAERMLERLSKT